MLRARNLHRLNDVADTVRCPHHLAILYHPMQLVLRGRRVGERACDPWSGHAVRFGPDSLPTLQDVKQPSRVREPEFGIAVLKPLQ